MIRSINTFNQHIKIVGGDAAILPTFYQQTPSAGIVRYNGSGQYFEVYDGSYWVPIYFGNPNIDLNDSATAALNWAIEKMQKEKEIESLAKQNPAVQLALDIFQRAEEQLQTTIILSKEHDLPTTN